LPLSVIKDGVEETVSLPILEHPIMLSFPRFAVPGAVSGTRVRGITITGSAVYNFGKPLVALKQDLGVDDIRIRETSAPVAFARFLAKVAWASGAASGQLDHLDRGLCNAIMTEPNEIGWYVGTQAERPPMRPGILHEISFREDGNAGLLFADICLFAQYGTPRYEVVLGATDRRQRAA